jgi:hypothetical protein
MKAKIILEQYPPYLTPDKFYTLRNHQFDKDVFFLTTDDGSTTWVERHHVRFLDDIRQEKIDQILPSK